VNRIETDVCLSAIFVTCYGGVNVLRQQYEESIDGEINGLSRIYRQGGLRLLVRVIDRRARAPGANLYIVTDPSGEIIAGNVPKLQRGVMRKIGWTGRPFRYERYGEDDGEDHRAIAHSSLPLGPCSPLAF